VHGLGLGLELTVDFGDLLEEPFALVLPTANVVEELEPIAELGEQDVDLGGRCEANRC